VTPRIWSFRPHHSCYPTTPGPLPDLSIFTLVTQASLVVQVVMAGLMIAPAGSAC
jgi:hypothetical protein